MAVLESGRKVGGERDGRRSRLPALLVALLLPALILSFSVLTRLASAQPGKDGARDASSPAAHVELLLPSSCGAGEVPVILWSEYSAGAYKVEVCGLDLPPLLSMCGSARSLESAFVNACPEVKSTSYPQIVWNFARKTALLELPASGARKTEGWRAELARVLGADPGFVRKGSLKLKEPGAYMCRILDEQARCLGTQLLFVSDLVPVTARSLNGSLSLVCLDRATGRVTVPGQVRLFREPQGDLGTSLDAGTILPEFAPAFQAGRGAALAFSGKVAAEFLGTFTDYAPDFDEAYALLLNRGEHMALVEVPSRVYMRQDNVQHTAGNMALEQYCALINTDKRFYAPGDRLHWRAEVRRRLPEGYDFPKGRNFNVSLVRLAPSALTGLDRPADLDGKVWDSCDLVMGAGGSLEGELLFPQDTGASQDGSASNGESPADLCGLWQVVLRDTYGHVLSRQTVCLEQGLVSGRHLSVQPWAASVAAEGPSEVLEPGMRRFKAVLQDEQGRPVAGARLELSCLDGAWESSFHLAPGQPWFVPGLARAGDFPRMGQEAFRTLWGDIESVGVSGDKGETDPGTLLSAVTDSLGQAVFSLPVRPEESGKQGVSGEKLLGTPPGVSLIVARSIENGAVTAMAVCPGLEENPGRMLKLQPSDIPVAGRPCTLMLSLEDEAGAPLRDASLNVKAVPLRGQGNSPDSRKAENLPAVTTDEAGRARIEWTPRHEGKYTLQAVMSAENGDGASLEAPFMVMPSEHHQLGGRLDKLCYSPGEMAELTLYLPQAGPGDAGGDEREVVIFVEGGRMLRAVLKGRGPEAVWRFPVDRGMFPALAVKGACLYAGRLHTFSLGAGVFSRERVLSISLSTADQPQAGQRGTLAAAVQDSSGKPVMAELLLALQGPYNAEEIRFPGERSLGLLAGFYGGLPVSSWHMEADDMGRRFWPMPALFGLHGSGWGGGGASVRGLWGQLLNYHPIVWNTQIRTTSEGKAQVPITWPQGGGTWKICCKGVSGSENMGEAFVFISLPVPNDRRTDSSGGK